MTRIHTTTNLWLEIYYRVWDGKTHTKNKKESESEIMTSYSFLLLLCWWMYLVSTVHINVMTTHSDP